MRLVFFGTAEFAVPALRAVAEQTVLAVSQPDRPSGRGMGLKASPVKLAAQELGLEVATPQKCRAPEFVEQLESLQADALIVAAYGQILSQSVLDSVRRGGINLHGSILPKYRGAAPIQRAILEGETQTGVTLMQMDRGMDTGDVIAISRTPIGPDETYGELQERLAETGAELLFEWLERIVAGDYPSDPCAQSDQSRGGTAFRASGEPGVRPLPGLHPESRGVRSADRFSRRIPLNIHPPAPLRLSLRSKRSGSCADSSGARAHRIGTCRNHSRARSVSPDSFFGRLARMGGGPAGR
jgi:folate-dependent phosphoribosylglycinamide formyltransferase PurN